MLDNGEFKCKGVFKIVRHFQATKSALTPGVLEEQIQAHIATVPTTSQQDSNEVVKDENHAGSTDSTQPQTSETPDKTNVNLNCQQSQRPSSSDSKQSTHAQSRSNSSRPSKTPSTDQPMSLKELQETVSLN